MSNILLSLRKSAMTACARCEIINKLYFARLLLSLR